ncbi:MAG: magnesium and cobalt transport protein CorA [Actinobacteria bacterium]|nr:magnesium and cobalt transport protein CorA [Actinomycetota bacterium]
MIVDSALYLNGVRESAPADISDQVDNARANGGFVWIGLAEPTQKEFDHVVGELNFHPLAVEDAVSAKQRPKIEDYDGLTFFVIKTVFYNEARSEITTGELMCFVDKHFIVIVRHGEGSPLTTVRHDIEAHPAQLALGPFAVLHAVVDRVIDEYTKIATELENDDHLQHAYEHATGMDSLLTTVLQADLAHVQVRQNEDVRKISAWVALAAAPTMVAGIYGMNFDFMPELRWKFGYPLVIGIVTTLSSFLFYKFKKAKWL